MFERMRQAEIEGFSMKGFDDYQCLFIHIPKTGGMSVANCLFGAQVGHHRVSELELEFPHEYFRFTFVRDPYDRCKSAYQWYMDGGKDELDSLWADVHIRPFDSFKDFVLNGLEDVIEMTHFRPQTYWLDRAVDFIGCTEYLLEGVEYVRRVLNIPHKHLQWLNASTAIRDFVDVEVARKIADIYWEDYNLPTQRVSRA